MINKEFKEKACLLPWVCLAVASGNRIKVCCSSRTSYCKVDENTNLKEIWNTKFDEIRSDYLNGKIPPTCGSCFRTEARGLRSRRLRFKEWMYDMFAIEDDLKIQYLDINFSNICNLNCAMCSSEFSSAWIKHDKEIIDKFSFRKDVRPYLKKDILPMSFIDQINIKDLELVEVKGGEPTIDPQFIYFIDKFLRESGTARIHITSNLNILSSEIKERLSKLPMLAIDASIDGTGDVYKYIRGKNSNLNRVRDNLLYVSKLSNVHTLRVNITTSPYNLWNSHTLVPWVREIDPEIKVNWCPMSVSPYYLDPSLLPREYRNLAAEQIEKNIGDADDHHILDLDRTLKYLRAENPNNLSKSKLIESRKFFIQWTNQINKWRGMNIYDIVPELGNIKKEWTETNYK